MNRDEQGGAGPKIEALSKHSLLFLMGSFHFPQWKIFSQFIDKFLKF